MAGLGVSKTQGSELMRWLLDSRDLEKGPGKLMCAHQSLRRALVERHPIGLTLGNFACTIAVTAHASM